MPRVTAPHTGFQPPTLSHTAPHAGCQLPALSHTAPHTGCQPPALSPTAPHMRRRLPAPSLSAPRLSLLFQDCRVPSDLGGNNQKAQSPPQPSVGRCFQPLSLLSAQPRSPWRALWGPRCREEREGSRPARNLLWEQSTAFALLVSLLLPVPLCHSLGVGAAARALLLPEHGRARDARIPSSLDATAGQGAPRG